MELLYGLLVRLHPPAFRERFAAEMTLNFEEGGAERAGRFVIDGLVSLLRQWGLRSGWWKLGIAVAVASLQVVGISPVWHLHRRVAHLDGGAAFSLNDQQALVFIILCATAFFVVLATMIALWVRRLVNGRLRSTAGRRRVTV
jgi:hypothetical protein